MTCIQSGGRDEGFQERHEPMPATPRYPVPATTGNQTWTPVVCPSMRTSDTSDPDLDRVEGRVDIGGFEVVRPLAEGGMAMVYLCRAPDGRQVAVKRMSPLRALEGEARQLFLDEARIAAMLEHPNIAAVLGAGVEDDQPFLALEYVDGIDLRQLLIACEHDDRPLPHAVAAGIVMQAAAGLDHAHARSAPDGTPLGLVHRDVSLSNVMVRRDGVVKVIDFGIATSAVSSVVTNPGTVRGKASYMSPEQCTGDALDRRTDVFALGIILYELTTGARCFNGRTDFERMVAVVHGAYTPPELLVENYPPLLAAVVRKALARRADDRFASCADLEHALRFVVATLGWDASSEALGTTLAALGGEVTLGDGDAATLVSDVVPHALALVPTARHPRTRARGTLDPAACAPRTRARQLARFEISDDARTLGRRPLRRTVSRGVVRTDATLDAA